MTDRVRLTSLTGYKPDRVMVGEVSPVTEVLALKGLRTVPSALPTWVSTLLLSAPRTTGISNSEGAVYPGRADHGIGQGGRGGTGRPASVVPIYMRRIRRPGGCDRVARMEWHCR